MQEKITNNEKIVINKKYFFIPFPKKVNKIY